MKIEPSMCANTVGSGTAWSMEVQKGPFLLGFYLVTYVTATCEAHHCTK
jgi:hypothetical protein